MLQGGLQMTNSPATAEGYSSHSTEARTDQTWEGETADVEPQETVQPSSAQLKARIGVYTYSPVKPARDVIASMASEGNPSSRKRCAESTSTSVSARSKRMAPNLLSYFSASASVSSPTRAKSANRNSARKARHSADTHRPANNLVDSIRPGLMLLMIGLNPGLMTAATGHAYAHPSNHFWKLMHSSGLTSRLHLPSETRDLMDLYSIGNTNLCARATRDGAGLSKEEQDAGASILEEKVGTYRPEVVCIVGKGIWDTILKVKVKHGSRKRPKPEFKYGWQDESLWLGREVNDSGEVLWPGARTFVATSTSGLAVSTSPAEKAQIWKELGDWITVKRADSIVKTEESAVY